MILHWLLTPMEILSDMSLLIISRVHGIFYHIIFRKTPAAAAMRMSGTPTNADIGSYFVRFKVKDDFGKSSVYTIILTVTENFAPVNTTGTLTFDVYEYQLFSTDLLPLFTEPEGETLSWGLTGVPANLTWVTVDNTTNLMTGSPPSAGGVYNESLELQAFDPNGLTVSTTVYFNLILNHPPALSLPADFEFKCFEGKL